RGCTGGGRGVEWGAVKLEMSTELGQRLAQEQRLTPQMLQSLKYLQATAVELRDLIREEAEKNPTLEVEEGHGEREDIDEYVAREEGEREDGEEAAARHARQMELLTAGETLGDHLEGQLAGGGLSADVKRAAEWIIGNLDAGGWFRGRLEEVPGEAGVTARAAEEALRVVQSMDPPGVGARDLGECLWLQLRDAGWGENSLPARVAREGLEALASGGAAGVASKLRVSRAAAEEAVGVVKRLDPRPGLRYGTKPAPVVIPELEIVEGEDGAFRARLLTDGLPELRLSAEYEAMAADKGTAAEARSWIKKALRSGGRVMRCVEQRRATLLRVGQLVAERQGEYFREGLGRLRAMTLGEAAEALGVHETTVGRAVGGKYARTPQGVRELRYFFTTGLALEGGGALSHEAVRNEIARLVAREDARRPLSDAALAAALRKGGVAIARRTVAKYREQLGIEPSHRRKRRR
ncbi:MAG: RNA polymerase factor sigma-54, partial [Kiritimatiellae bacterium]|nr:RNA polymerase factor sigma-54 [Kiritimatiellia bacterium]